MFFKALISVFTLGIIGAMAETHTVTFTNDCGCGTPTLVQGDHILSTGASFTINGPLIAAIAYLQTGNCGLNGEGCTIIDITLKNPTPPGLGSSVDISLIPPQTFSVTSSFNYFNGCDGAGAECKNANCPAAFHNPTDPGDLVPCEANNVNLAITFCD